MLACETHIAPNDLLEAPEGVLNAMVEILEKRAKDAKHQEMLAKARRL